jgi:hypothetical protein
VPILPNPTLLELTPDPIKPPYRAWLGYRAGYGAGSRVVPIPSKNYGAGRKARPYCAHRAQLVRAWWPAYRRLPPVFAYRATTIVGSPSLSGWTSKLGAACAIAPRRRLSAWPRLRLTASGPPCAKTGELRFLAPAAIAAGIGRTSFRREAANRCSSRFKAEWRRSRRVRGREYEAEDRPYGKCLKRRWATVASVFRGGKYQRPSCDLIYVTHCQ